MGHLWLNRHSSCTTYVYNLDACAVADLIFTCSSMLLGCLVGTLTCKCLSCLLPSCNLQPSRHTSWPHCNHTGSGSWCRYWRSRQWHLMLPPYHGENEASLDGMFLCCLLHISLTTVHLQHCNVSKHLLIKPSTHYILYNDLLINSLTH